MRKLPKSLLALAAAGSLALVGCSDDAAKENPAATDSPKDAADGVADKLSDKKDEIVASMKDWDGSYRSLGSYVNDPSTAAEFASHAANHSQSWDELASTVLETYGDGQQGLVIDGENMTFVRDYRQLDQPADAPSAYEYVETVNQPIAGDDEITWYVFRAKNDSAPYPFVLLSDKEDEDGATYFHARFGDDKDALLHSDQLPTFVDPETANQATIEHLLFGD